MKQETKLALKSAKPSKLKTIRKTNPPKGQAKATEVVVEEGPEGAEEAKENHGEALTTRETRLLKSTLSLQAIEINAIAILLFKTNKVLTKFNRQVNLHLMIT